MDNWTEVAARVFKIKPESVSADLRDLVKARAYRMGYTPGRSDPEVEDAVVAIFAPVSITAPSQRHSGRPPTPTAQDKTNMWKRRVRG